MNDLLINRVLVATDFSECVRRAGEYGMCVAQAWSAHVDLLYWSMCGEDWSSMRRLPILSWR